MTMTVEEALKIASKPCVRANSDIGVLAAEVRRLRAENADLRNAKDEATARAERAEAELKKAMGPVAWNDGADPRIDAEMWVFQGPCPHCEEHVSIPGPQVAAPTAQVPQGWTIRREGEAISMWHPGIGGLVIHKKPGVDQHIQESLLYALASDMLQAVSQGMTTDPEVKP